MALNCADCPMGGETIGCRPRDSRSVRRVIDESCKYLRITEETVVCTEGQVLVKVVVEMGQRES
jgi:hypothetical protein